MSLDAIRAKAKPTVKPVTLFLDGEKAAQIEDKVRELQELEPSDSLDGNPQKTAIEEELVALYDEAKDTEQTFVFQSLGARRWNRLMAEHPGRDGHQEAWNVETFPAAAMSESLMGPKLTAHELHELEDLLTPGQWDTLWSVCWLVNNGANAIPKSVRRSEGTRNSDETPTTSAPEESLTPSSLAEP